MEQQEKRKKKKKKKRFRLLLLFEILLILLLVPVVFLVYQINRIPSRNIKLDSVAVNEFNDENIKDYQNIVVYGVDSRANDLKKNTRSDSIIIVSINKKTKDIKLLSVFRDTYVNVEGHGYTRVNHAYAYGGPELAISTLNKNFDLDIQDFVTVNFSAVSNVIDLLGGVEIDIRQDELKFVNAYTRDVARINGVKCVYLKKAGRQTLSGTQATAYCRVRYTSGGDFTRAKRQRTVMSAVFDKLRHSSIPTLFRILDEMLPQVYTSLSTPEILKLGMSIFSYDIVKNTGFPFDNKPKTIGGAAYVLPDTLSSNVTKMHSYLFGTRKYKPSGAVEAISREIAAR